MSQPHPAPDSGPILRIGGASAFWGDSSMGIEQLVQSGNVDVLVFDYLAELTLSLMARARVKDAEAGYATDFVQGVAPWLRHIKDAGIRLLSNAGGINPQACARALRAAARQAGVELRIAVIEGDDLSAEIDSLRAAGVREMFSGAALPQKLTSINAYLGAQPVAAALAAGADVVITGRCVDSALALGALIHHFGWRADDFDRLAAGSLVGHMLECTTQTTGGLYTDWELVPDWENIGYPIAECAADGSFVLTKPQGTGGLILPTVAAEQMLYEIGNPGDYPLPDVRCDFTGVTIEAVGKDRVRFSGARGTAPGDAYKVSATFHDGFRLSSSLTIVGDDASAKAQRVAAAILARTRGMLERAGFSDYTATEVEVLGSEVPSYGAGARARASREVVLRLTCSHESAAALNILAREFAPFGTAGAPGTTGFSGRAKAQPVFRLFSFLWPQNRIPVTLEIDGAVTAIPLAQGISAQSALSPSRYPEASLADGERIRVPIYRLAVARSGDKGDNAHIAIIARDPRFVPFIGHALSCEAVGAHLRHLAHGPITRYDVPGVNAYSFVLQQALGGGGAASLRNDPLGKTFGQILLAFELEVPRAYLD